MAMNWDLAKELGKAILWVIIGIIMYPMLGFLDWGWDKWARLWGKSRAANGLFVLYAPVMLFCFAICWMFADRWQKLIG